MNNKDLTVFDKDDWLKQERIRESRVSVWDFDEGRTVRNEHMDSCDVRTAAKSHSIEHMIDARRSRQSVEQIDGNDRPQAIAWFVGDIILLFILVFVNMMLGRYAFYPAIALLFLAINPGIFIWVFIFRSFPSAGYCKTVFILALICQFAGVFLRLMRFY